MVLKTTSLSSRFQHKNRFGKIRTESRDISRNGTKFSAPNQICKILYILNDISGLSEYFSKPIFELKTGAQAGRLSNMNPINKWNEIFFEL